jgi:hypothetical protein
MLQERTPVWRLPGLIRVIEPEEFIHQSGPYRNRAPWIDLDLFKSGRESLLPKGLLAIL